MFDNDISFVSNLLSDDELMKLFQEGDKEAFGYLYLRHKPKLTSIALSYLKNLPDAEDAVQASFISAMRGAKNFKYQSQVCTWLVRILINECLNSLKSNKKNLLLLSYENIYNLIENSYEFIDSHFEMELKLALKKLPISQQRALIMTEYFGLSVKELAIYEHCNEKTIRSRCFRARLKMKQEQATKMELIGSHQRGD